MPSTMTAVEKGNAGAICGTNCIVDPLSEEFAGVDALEEPAHVFVADRCDVGFGESAGGEIVDLPLVVVVAEERVVGSEHDTIGAEDFARAAERRAEAVDRVVPELPREGRERGFVRQLGTNDALETVHQ